MWLALALTVALALGVYLWRRNRESDVPTSLPGFPIDPAKAGIRTDLSRLEAGWAAYPSCENVLDHQASFRVRPGLTKVGNSLGSRVVGAISYPAPTDPARLVAVTTTGMAVYNIAGGTWTDVTNPLNPLTGGAANVAILRTLESGANVLTLAINGKDAPIAWANDPLVKYRLLTCEVPRTPRCMVVCNNRLVFGNISELSPQGVDYSNPLDPDHGWGVNEIILGDTPGDIVAMRELGNLAFVVYKSDAIYMAQAIAGAETFTFQFHSAYNAGPLGPAAVLSVGEGLHMYLAIDGGLYKFDGVQPLLLVEHLRTYIASRLDRSRMNRSFAFLDPETSLAYFFYPVKGAAEVMSAVVLDLTTGAAWPWRWSAHGFSCALSAGLEAGVMIKDLPLIGDMTMTFGEMSTLSPTLLVGDSTGQFYALSGYTDDGVAIPFSWETGDADLGSALNYKLVTASEHEFQPTLATQTVSFQLGTSSSETTPTWEDAQTFDLLDPGPYELGHRLTGRKIAVRFSGSATQPVTWLRSRLFLADGGRR